MFNEPNLAKFTAPTVIGVDFPRVALSEAAWDGRVLRIAAHPQRPSLARHRTELRVTNLGPGRRDWMMTGPDGTTVALPSDRQGDLVAAVTCDNQTVELSPQA